MSPGLEFVDVGKRFRDGARGEVLAVKGVTFQLRAGDIVALRGPSGAGKTTVLTLAAGLLLPTEGDVLLDGESFSRLREAFRASIRRERMGVLMQSLALVPRMSVLENVLLAGIPDGDVDAAAIERATALLARFGLADFARSHVDGLSGGERQRVALVRAFVRAPSVALLDEPTAHLDAGHVETIAALLREHSARGGMALIATHDPRILESDAITRAVEIRGGLIAG